MIVVTSADGRANITNAITDIAGRQYSRRGMFGFLGKAGLVLMGAAAGIGVPMAAEACTSPPPTCQGPCVACQGTFCTLLGYTCQCFCSCPCPYDGSCMCQPDTCYYAYGEIGSACGFSCVCYGCPCF